MFNSLFLIQTRREMFNSLFLLQRKEGRCSTVCFYYRDKKGDVQHFILSCKKILLNNLLYKKFILYFSDIGPNIDTGPVNAMVMVGRACVVCIALCYVQTSSFHGIRLGYWFHVAVPL
jgi:hypothetical protein